MNKVRYIDKKILCNYDLREDFFQELGINIYDMTPLRKVFVLFTDKGKKILKMTESSKERIEFIDKALNYINQEFPNVLQYSLNRKNEIITNWKGQKFILLDMMDGREATFTNPVEIELCAEALANMHMASRGIIKEFDYEELNRNKGKELINQFSEEFLTITEIERIVNKFKYKNEFDSMFLNVVEETKKDLEKAIQLLSESKYRALLEDYDKRVLCHNDLAHHNFIIDNNDVKIIDFDYCTINTRIVDLYNYTVKVIKNLAYDKNIISLILNSYSKVSEITMDEVEVLFALINYPRDIINISLDYYLKQKSWDEEVFISRFENKIELEEFRRELISTTDKYFN